MKVFLKPLYSKLNTLEGCPLGCQELCKVSTNSELKPAAGCTCPLRLHQAKTYAEVTKGSADIIFNRATTADGKSLAAYLPGLLDPNFRIMSLYPTIELVTDQERQIRGDPERQSKGYLEIFQVEQLVQVDSLYGAELARRVEGAGKGAKFKALWRSLKQQSFILTNPDIFHLIAHSRYFNPGIDPIELPGALARYPDLYIADEFHIFGVHQEAAILNSLLLIRYSRLKKRPLRVLFTSATPKTQFVSQLQQAGFKVAMVEGSYTSESANGFRPILQPATLEFVPLEPEVDALTWLKQQAATIQESLVVDGRGRGRGLIILNSVAMVSRVVRELQALFPETQVKVREISGRIDRQERLKTQAELKDAPESVLIVATSAVDVGVDFRIHLLIFEASDSATFIQRLGRLGRHPDFDAYKAFVLIPGRTPWIVARLKERLTDGQTISRVKSSEDDPDLREIVEFAFDPPREFEQYRAYWGALQAQGMLLTMSRNKDRARVMQPIQESMMADLRRVYGEQLDKKRGRWCALSNDNKGVGKAVQQEVLRFRGGSNLQAAVWDNTRFYTYDLLRLLPHIELEIIDRDTFLKAAKHHNHSETEFDDRYIQVYLQVQLWLDQREPIELKCDRGSDELRECTLSLIDRLSITGHPQSAVTQCLQGKKLLAFLVSVNRKPQNSHWDISQTLHLNPNFGLYRLTDLDEQPYACAFGQDALLLEALKWRLKPCEKAKPYIF